MQPEMAIHSLHEAALTAQCCQYHGDTHDVLGV